MKRALSLTLLAILLAGCSDAPPADHGAAIRSGPFASERLAVGDVYVYEGEPGRLRLEVQAPRTTWGPQRTLVKVAPVVVDWTPRGSSTFVVSAMLDVASRAVVATLSECPLQRLSDGTERCFDVRVMDYDVGPTTFPVRDALRWEEGDPSVDAVVTMGGDSTPFRYAVAADGTDCVALEAADEPPAAVGWVVPFVGPSTSFTFCGRGQLPQEIRFEGGTLALAGHEPGELPLEWAAPAAPEASAALATGAARATPPESGVGSFPIKEAYEQAKARDAAFAQFLSTHPKAILRESRQESTSEASGGSALPAARTQTRMLVVGVPGSMELHEVRIRRTLLDNAPPLYQVVESKHALAATPGPAEVDGPHVTLDAAKGAADGILPSAFSWVNVESTHVDAVGRARLLQDRWHYDLLYEGARVEAGATSHEFKYRVRMDSRTGDLVQLVGPLAALAWE